MQQSDPLFTGTESYVVHWKYAQFLETQTDYVECRIFIHMGRKKAIPRKSLCIVSAIFSGLFPLGIILITRLSHCVAESW